MAELRVFAHRKCGDKVVYCDGECQGCVARSIVTTDGRMLFPGPDYRAEPIPDKPLTLTYEDFVKAVKEVLTDG